MGALLDTWHLVEGPVAVPQPYGIFSVAEPRLTTDDHWRLGVQWQSQFCGGGVLRTAGPCIEPRGEGGLFANDYCSILDYEPFTLYMYSTAPLPGYTIEEHRAHATARLVASEQQGVESELWARMTASVAPTALTSFSPDYALGWLENQLADAYYGQGVIHMNKVAATVFSDTQIYPEGGRLRTNLGTSVVVSSSYDQPAFPPTGTAIIYGTGPLVLYRGDIDVREDAINKATNQVSIVAQRDYVIGWDCATAAVELTLSSPSI